MLEELYKIEEEILGIIESVCGVGIDMADMNLVYMGDYTQDDQEAEQEIISTLKERYNMPDDDYFDMLCEGSPLRLVAIAILEKPTCEVIN